MPINDDKTNFALFIFGVPIVNGIVLFCNATIVNTLSPPNFQRKSQIAKSLFPFFFFFFFFFFLFFSDQKGQRK